MSNEADADWPSDWPGWLLKILRDVEAAESAAGVEPLGGEPGWVLSMVAELVKLFAPTAKISEARDNPVRYVGAFLGHQEWLLDDKDGLSKVLARASDAWERANAEAKATLSANAYRRRMRKIGKATAGLKELSEKLETALTRKREAIKAGRDTVGEQTIAVRKDFFDAYGRALNTKLLDDEGHWRYEKEPSTTCIYLVMIANWRYVKSLGSLVELYGWLCEKLGPKIEVGSFDRLRKLCNRHGLKLAKAGRPRK